MSLTRNAVLVALLAATAIFPGHAQQPQPRATAQTALDRYVAAPDANFSWKVLKPLPAEGVTATLLEMTSQKWLTEQEVERPLWTHWLTVDPAGEGDERRRAALHHRRQPRAAAAVDAAGMAGRRGEGHRHGDRGAAPGAESAGRVHGRPREEAAHRGRLHRLHVGQVPAHRRREMAGAPADDQERGARDGRGHRSSRRRRKAAGRRSRGSSSRARRSAAGRRGRRRPSISGSSPSRRRSSTC